MRKNGSPMMYPVVKEALLAGIETPLFIAVSEL